MGNKFLKTCFGGVAAAVFCFAATPFVHGAGSSSLEDMERELNALRASVSNLTEQIETVKSGQVVSTASLDESEKGELEALRSEVNFLKGEFQTAAQAEELKAEDIAGNVYSKFAKRVQLGGSIRTRAEYANGFYSFPGDVTVPGFSYASVPAGGAAAGTRPKASIDDDYVINQTRLWADADVNEHLRIFIQLQDARAFGVEGTTVGFAADGANNRIDIHQGYFDLKNLFDLPLTVRVGRQEIIWGDHRVIGNLVWSNQGRVFDGGRFMWDTDTIHAEAFAIKVDEDGYLSSSVDGSGNSDENIYAGMLAFKKLLPGALIELMYIQKNNQDDTAAVSAHTGAGSGNTIIHDFGIRIDGKLPNMDAVDYTLESHGQTGDVGDLDHEAWAFAGRIGYTFKDVAWTPRIGFEYAFASGDDDPADGDHDTFDNLYPTNHWQGNYGFVDLVSWQNMHDFRTNLKVNPTNKLMVQADYHYFLLDEEEDGWYNAGAGLVASRPVGGYSGDDKLGQEVDFTASYQLYKNVAILAGYSWFTPGDWIEDNIGDFDTHWGYIQTTVTF